jgi:hypothetical protein
LLSLFEPYRPYFIAGGGALLLYAGTRIFGPVPADAAADCPADACAPRSPSRRRTRVLFLAASAVYVLAIIYPNVLAALYG